MDIEIIQNYARGNTKEIKRKVGAKIHKMTGNGLGVYT